MHRYKIVNKSLHITVIAHFKGIIPKEKNSELISHYCNCPRFTDTLTLAMLNKLRCHVHFKYLASQIT